jgi:predicted RNA-binding protein YlxR (DUF448 family)
MAAPERKAVASRRGGGRRRDAVSRTSDGRELMIRFVVAADGVVLPDVAEKVPGRGIWLRADRSVIEASIDGRAFARAARRAVRVSPSLLDELEALMRRRCVDGLGLARRAGRLLVGFDKVVEALQNRQVGLLVTAAGASDGQRRRLLSLAEGIPVAGCLSREEVGGAIGREEVTYAALTPGALAQRLDRDMRRLAGILGGLSSSGPSEAIGDDEFEGGMVARDLAAPSEGNGADSEPPS